MYCDTSSITSSGKRLINLFLPHKSACTLSYESRQRSVSTVPGSARQTLGRRHPSQTHVPLMLGTRAISGVRVTSRYLGHSRRLQQSPLSRAHTPSQDVVPSLAIAPFQPHPWPSCHIAFGRRAISGSSRGTSRALRPSGSRATSRALKPSGSSSRATSRALKPSGSSRRATSRALKPSSSRATSRALKPSGSSSRATSRALKPSGSSRATSRALRPSGSRAISQALTSSGSHATSRALKPSGSRAIFSSTHVIRLSCYLASTHVIRLACYLSSTLAIRLSCYLSSTQARLACHLEHSIC